MFRNAKLDLYIIIAALIIASFVIGLFWFLNRGETPTYVYNQVSPSSTTIDAEDADKTEPIEPSSENTRSEPVASTIITRQGLAKITEPTTVKALVFGDSVAESLGSSNKDELGWHSLVSKDFQSKYPGKFQWVFKTTPNATVNDALSFAPEVAPDTDLIILCLGSNDWAVLRTKDFKQKSEQLISVLKTSNPNANVILVIEPPVKSIQTNNKSFPYRQVIIELGKEHQLPVIDEWSAFIQDPTPLAQLLADGVNPNDKGYRIFADEVMKGFDGVLADKY